MKGKSIVRIIVSVGLVLVLVSVVGVAGCAQPAPTPTPARAPTEWEQLVAKAKTEGKVTFYGNVMKKTQSLWTDYFAKNYPEIKLEFQLLTGGTALAKLTAEQAAKTYVCDIFSSATATVAQASDAGYLMDFVPPELIDPNVKWALGDPLALRPQYVIYTTPYGITFNTNLAPPGTEPKSWKDLADPKWKGKFVTEDPRNQGKGNKWFLYMYNNPAYGPDYLKKVLVDNKVTCSSDAAGLAAMVARGEYAADITSTFKFYQSVQQTGINLPLAFHYYDDPTMRSDLAAAVANNAPHPNAAKLFLNYLLSADGQAALADGDTAIPVRLGTKLPYPDYQNLANVKLITPLSIKTEQDELTKMRDLAKQMLGG